MIIFLLFALVVIAGCSILATSLTKKYKTISKWDYLYPYLGIPLWLILITFRIGKAASLSNFVVENFWIIIVSIATPWIVYLLYRIKNTTVNLIANMLTAAPIIFTVVLRLLIETLPE